MLMTLNSSPGFRASALNAQRACQACALWNIILHRAANLVQPARLHFFARRTDVGVSGWLILELAVGKYPQTLFLLPAQHVSHVSADIALLAGNIVFRCAVLVIGDRG